MNTHGQSLLFEYPLFRRNSFSRLYHILPDCFKPYRDFISFTQYMLQFAFIFDTEIPSGTFMYMSESNDSYKYAIMTSINCKESGVCFIKINAGSLRKTLCNQPRFVSYHLIIFVSLSNKNPLEPNKKGYGRCWYHLCEHLSFLK
jgi:hypothetical protein